MDKRSNKEQRDKRKRQNCEWTNGLIYQERSRALVDKSDEWSNIKNNKEIKHIYYNQISGENI